MIRLIRGFVIAMLACTPALACNVVNVSGPGPGGQTGQPTVLDACNAVLSVARASAPTRNYQLTSTGGTADSSTYPPASGEAGTCVIDSNPYESALRVQRSWSVVDDSTGTCEPRPCSGLGSDGVGDHWTTTHYPGADGYCNAVSHCRMRVSSAVGVDGVMVYSVQHTSETCVNGTHDADSSAAFSDGESCASSGANEFCLSNQGTNCGYLNDNFVCLPTVENDGCQVNGDGSRVCGAQAPTPPAPDNGTPGQRAMPDATLSGTVNTATNTYNFFSSSTVSSSARPVGTSGDNPYDGSDDGSGTSTGGAGSGADGNGDDGDCLAGQTCDGSGGNGDFEAVCTFQECTQTFFNRVQASPLVSSLTSITFPSGSCPSWSIEAFGETYSLSAPMCEVWENIAPVLSVLFLAIWGWVATRIVLSA